MKRLALIALTSLFALSACEDGTTSVKQQQAQQAETAANSLTFSGNAEIENIKRRLELTSKPGMLGFILLLNQSGQPIAYHAVKGKVTSSGKRLTRPDEKMYSTSEGIRAAPSDEGTYGSSDPYIYFWTTGGQYVQWSGEYLYSDKPIRTRISPLVVTTVK